MAGGRLGRRTALWLAAAVGVCIGATAPASEGARVAIDSCLEKLNSEIDVGYERIAARCPDLARRLEAGGWSAWLPRDWKRPGNDLSAGGLRQLESLLALQGTVGSNARPRQLSTAQLPAVLASLAGSGVAERKGWWARTKAWLRDVFERDEEDDDWYSRVVGQGGVSQAIIERISYVALALVVVLAAIIVANELRVDGVLLRLRQRFLGWGRGRTMAGNGRDDGGLGWGDVQSAALAQRPRLLLELITSRLTAEGRLPQSRGLTIRELMRAVRLPDEVDRERLAELARLSEHVRFSNDGPAASETVAAALEGGRSLLERVGRRS